MKTPRLNVKTSLVTHSVMVMNLNLLLKAVLSVLSVGTLFFWYVLFNFLFINFIQMNFRKGWIIIEWMLDYESVAVCTSISPWPKIDRQSVSVCARL